MLQTSQRIIEAEADVAIVGGGIVGLAHAFAAAEMGKRVLLFERDGAASGASIRNFGMILPVGMATGAMHNRAMRSRARWRTLAEQCGFWHDSRGSLIAAYHEDELAVLHEFSQRAPQLGYPCLLQGAEEMTAQSPALNPVGLLGGLASSTEIIIDPRQALATLSRYLQQHYPVTFQFHHAVTAIEPPFLRAADKWWRAQQIVLCSGTDFATLYPQRFADSGLIQCKLQMLRTVPQPSGWRFGPMLATGFSLIHYPAFSLCPSLPQLQARLSRDHAQLLQWGIHFLACQNGRGEITLGDSHEYGLPISPFNREEIDELLLTHFQQFLHLPNGRISQRWHGVYAKHATEPFFLDQPEPGVRIVTGLGGAGMSISFGLAEELMQEWA